jgi:hypothetical protein
MMRPESVAKVVSKWRASHGPEARRKIDVGEPRERSRVLLPLSAGMTVAVLLYLLVNAGESSARGWRGLLNRHKGMARLPSKVWPTYLAAWATWTKASRAPSARRTTLKRE